MDSIKFFNDKNLLNSSTNAKSNSKNNNIDTIKTSETVNIDKYKNKVNEVLNFATTSLESVPNKQEERKWYDFGGHIQDAFQTAAGTISNGVNCIWNNLQSAYNNSINAIGEQFSKTQVFKIVDKTIGWDIPKKVLSSVGNASVAVTKGIENVVEGTLDILQLTGGAILTPITGIVDGIIYATGNDLGLTNYLWNKQIRPSVEYKIMDNITDAYYKGHGKIMNDNAFELLKNNSVGFNIFEQIGGVLGTLAGGQLLSSSGIFGSTAGITSKAFVRASTAIAGASGVGQGTEDAWNDGADIEKGLIYGVSRGIVDGLQYWLGGKINSIVLGKGTSLVSKIGGASVRVVLDGVDGAVEVPVEAALKSIYNDKTWNENFDEAGGWNGVAQQFLLGSGFSFASEIGGPIIKKGILKKEIKKMNNNQLLLFIKQSIDENNFNDIIKQIDANRLSEIFENMDNITMKKVISSMDNKTFDKLYINLSDDLKNIISLNNYRPSNSKFHSSVIESAISTIDDELGSCEGIKKLKQFENAKKYNSDYDIAIEYGDRTQYMYLRLKELIENTGNQQLIDYYEKIKNLPNYEKNSEEIFKTIKPFMNKDEQLALSKFNVFNLFSNSDYKDLHKLDNMFGYQSIFNQNEKSEMKIYSSISGPIIAGYNRGIDEQFITRRGQSQLYRLSEAQKNYEFCRLSCSEYGKKNISDAVSCIDEVIEKATPLAQDTILYRGANSIFNDGQLIDINNIKVGQIISDKAHVSTSLLKDKCYLNNNIVLEIMAPKGTKCAYLESFTYGYGQQEVLLPRNSKFRVISEPEPVDFNGKDQMVIKVEII